MTAAGFGLGRMRDWGEGLLHQPAGEFVSTNEGGEGHLVWEGFEALQWRVHFTLLVQTVEARLSSIW